jgi:hypothetical protein
MKNKPWTLEEINFLKENYPLYGKLFCAEKLNRKGSSIFKKASRLSLKVNYDIKLINNQAAQIKYQSERPNDVFNVNIEQFLDIEKPEVAYLLGFLWADGYIVRTEVRLEIVKTDMDNIKHILDSIGTWTYSDRQRKNWKVISRATTSNKRLVEFLKEHDYDKKSYVSADKILSKIPNDLKHYFFRGLVDGDGCISLTNTRLLISSTLKQDWTYVKTICCDLNINSNIYRNEYKNSWSVIDFNGINAINFCEFIYNGIIFGLNRKYNNYLEMKEYYMNSKKVLLNIKKAEALSLYKSGMPITKIIKAIDIPSTTLRRYLHSVT